MRHFSTIAIAVSMTTLVALGCTVEVESTYDAKATGTDSSTPPPDGSGTNGNTDGSGGDGSSDSWRWQGAWSDYEDEDIERGETLFKNVMYCVDCHTPRTESGEIDEEQFVAGVEGRFDLAPEVENVGVLHAPNITPSESGIRSWSPEKVKQAITDGYYIPEEAEEDGEAGKEDRYIIFPLMPYWEFNNIREEDLNDLVAYMRTLDPVDKNIPDRQPLPGPSEQNPKVPPFNNIEKRTEPVSPVPLQALPDTTLSEGDPNYQKATEGKYWAAMASCLDCHTPLVPPKPPENWDPKPKSEGGDGPNYEYVPSPPPLAYRGADRFPTADLGLNPEKWGPIIWSRNLTPGKNGVGNYSANQIVSSLNSGEDAQGRPMCPPMPAGPGGAFSGMPEEIKSEIAWYITTIPGKPPNENPQLMQEEIPNCVPPGAN